MSEPYLPLYIGDYLKDTRFLTLEHHGAYFMLLMGMWSAGGTLPDDEVKLSRLVGVSVKKWRPIWAELTSYFDHSEGLIKHKRITIELEKAEALRAKRASAGALGGAAKSLKTNKPAVANAKAEPQQIILGQEERDASQAQHPVDAAGKIDFNLLDTQLRSAAGLERDPNPGLMSYPSIVALLKSGHDLELDILATIRAVASRSKRAPRSWDYFTEAIMEASAKRRGLEARGLSPPIAPAPGKTNIFESMATEARNGPSGSGGKVGITIDAVSGVPRIGRQIEPDDGKGILARH